MSDSPSETQSQEPQSDPKPSSPDPPEAAAADAVQVETGGEAVEDDGEEEEEKGECGFCLFMKGGGCKESFEAWENCIEEAEKTNEDIVEKCFEMTSKLKDCMLAHPDYYEPILRAEKAAEEQAIKDLDSEISKDKEEEEDVVETPAAEGKVSSEGGGEEEEGKC